MTTPALIWLIIYCAASLLFFGAAVVIVIVGMKDMKDLLSAPEKESTQP